MHSGGRNIACEVDVASGRIKTVVERNGPDMDILEDHPKVSGPMGLQLPHWDALREMNERAARIYAPICYQSTDIVSPKREMVELNYGGGFDLPQNTNGSGILTPEVMSGRVILCL